VTYIPQPGDIGLVPISGQTGRLIRFGQFLVAKLDDDPKIRDFESDDEDWRDDQHAFVLLDDGTLIEAEPGGARIRPLTEYSPDEIYWCENLGKSLTPAQRAGIVAKARSFEHTPYSFLDYFAIALHALHIPIPFLRRYLASLKHLICSQLSVMSWLLGADINLFPHQWPGYVDPLDLYLLDRSLVA
jgi:hypothetical protein